MMKSASVPKSSVPILESTPRACNKGETILQSEKMILQRSVRVETKKVDVSQVEFELMAHSIKEIDL